MPDLITLAAWAEARYGNAAPRAATLRRWARDARIFPAPVKHGRTYFVRPDAEYLEHHHEPTTARRLTEKLARSSA